MADKKRQDLPGDGAYSGLPPGLWVVATPIGNLEDLTRRAREALGRASVVYCEDTRRTSRLMAALGLERTLERLDAHAGPRRIESVVERLGELEASGQGAALVTDAGTPAISDPGGVLVAAARAAGVRITPVPGCSAVTALLSVAGWEAVRFSFEGFFPRKDGERGESLQAAARSGGVHVWFESPERVAGSLGFAASRIADKSCFAAKELTKLHEKFFNGTIEKVAAEVVAEVESEGTVGEWVFAIDMGPAEVETGDWKKALACCLDAGVSASGAARQVSQHFGVSRNVVYEAALAIAGKKTSGGD